jgi:hypothetical protein
MTPFWLLLAYYNDRIKRWQSNRRSYRLARIEGEANISKQIKSKDDQRRLPTGHILSDFNEISTGFLPESLIRIIAL